MRHKTLTLLMLAALAAPVCGKAVTGLYFAPIIWSSTTLYTPTGPADLDPSLSKDAISLMLSLYSDHFFEINIHAMKEMYADPDFRDRYSVSLEAGKLFSSAIYSHDQIVITPACAIGAFIRFNIMSSASGSIHSEYGLYAMFKLRFNALGRMFGFSSIDLGYKYMLPVSDSFYPGNQMPLTSRHIIFFGFSF